MKKILFFELKSWFNQFGKYEVHIFTGCKSFFSIKKDPQTLFQDQFCPKTGNEKKSMFGLQSWLTNLKNMQKCDY